jgi:hypothetical protein
MYNDMNVIIIVTFIKSVNNKNICGLVAIFVQLQ